MTLKKAPKQQEALHSFLNHQGFEQFAMKHLFYINVMTRRTRLKICLSNAKDSLKSWRCSVDPTYNASLMRAVLLEQKY